MFNNPFIYGRPILSKEFFVGRNDIKQKIIGGLSNLNSTSIIGGGRIGKTSLLLEIHRRLREIKEEKSFLGVYIDCTITTTIEVFWREFISQLKVEANEQIGQIINQIETSSSIHKSNIEIVAEQIIKTLSLTHYIVILLDEFDYIYQSERFAESFFSTLRSYGSFYVAYITTSRQSLARDHAALDSPFWNIFTKVNLGLFSENEARGLLNKQLADGHSVFNEEEIDYILKVSGYYPYFLQAAASIMYTIKYIDIEETEKDWRDIHLDHFQTEARQHFAFFWSKCSIEEKKCLMALSGGEMLPGIENMVIYSLLERSLITKRENEIRPFSPIWAKWILNQGRIEKLEISNDDIEQTKHATQQEDKQITAMNDLSYPKPDLSGRSSIIKILFLTANPIDSARLRLDEEVNKIDNAIRQADFRDRFDIKQHWAVGITDLQSYLLRHKPDIVHFSGHGSRQGEIILEDPYGQSKPVPIPALSKLFAVLKDNIRCVVLNACFSEGQAQAIAENIDCVIGMSP